MANSFLTSGNTVPKTDENTNLKIVLVLAKLRICPRTTPMPRSSDAFNFKQKWNISPLLIRVSKNIHSQRTKSNSHREWSQRNNASSMTSKAVLMSSKADEYEKDDCYKLVDSSCNCMVMILQLRVRCYHSFTITVTGYRLRFYIRLDKIGHFGDAVPS